MIPISTMMMIANTIAPRRPNMNQPATNAITESIVMWVHSTFIAILIALHFSKYQRITSIIADNQR